MNTGNQSQVSLGSAKLLTNFGFAFRNLQATSRQVALLLCADGWCKIGLILKVIEIKPQEIAEIQNCGEHFAAAGWCLKCYNYLNICLYIRTRTDIYIYLSIYLSLSLSLCAYWIYMIPVCVWHFMESCWFSASKAGMVPRHHRTRMWGSGLRWQSWWT